MPGKRKLKKAVKKKVVSMGGSKKYARQTARAYGKTLKAGSTPAEARKKSTSTKLKMKRKPKKAAKKIRKIY